LYELPLYELPFAEFTLSQFVDYVCVFGLHFSIQL
jgi:hypothetical protein